MWDVTKAVIRGKFITKVSRLENKSSPINDLSCHLKQIEKEQMKLKASKRKEIVQVKMEDNEIDQYRKINKTKSCSRSIKQREN